MATNSPGEPRVVRGEIVCDEGAFAVRDAVVYVRVEDVSVADAPARVVAQQKLSDGAAGEGRIPFELAVEGIDERASYSVAVLVDLDGDGRAGPGDFRTMQSYPVLTRSLPSEVRVEVRRVE